MRMGTGGQYQHHHQITADDNIKKKRVITPEILPSKYWVEDS